MIRKQKDLLKKFTRILIVGFTSASLSFSPVLFAVETETNNWVNTGIQTLNQVSNVIMNYQNVAATAAQRASLAESLQINYRQDSMFGCPMAEAISKFPEGYCEAPLESAEVEISQWLTTKAAERLDFYEQLENKVQTPAIGLKCMENAKKLQADDFQTKMNSLTTLIANVKEQDENFKADLNDKITEMKELYGDIYGQTKGNGTLSEATENYEDTFSSISGCTSILTPSALGAKGRDSGLDGIRKYMNNTDSGKSIMDRTYAINDGTIKNDLNNQIDKIVSKIESGGVEDVSDIAGNLSSINSGGTSFAKMQSVLTEKASEVTKQKEKLAELLKSAGINRSVPDLDENFSERISIMETEATTTFKDSLIEACAQNPEYVGISFDDIVSGIKMKGGGATLTNYKTKFQSILDSSASLDDKISSLNDLNSKYQSSGIYVQSGNQSYRPNEILGLLVDKCEAKYDAGTLKASDQETFKRKIELISDAVSDLKTMESSFTGDIKQSLKDEILNCSSSSMEGVGGCTAENLDPSSNAGFCLSSASTCASKISSCMNNINNMITSKTNQINNKATAYNELIDNYIKTRKQQLATKAAYSFLNSDWLTNFFSGSKVEVPELVLTAPEKSVASGSFANMQVELLGGGSMDFLDPTSEDSFVAQLEKIGVSLEAQQKVIQQEMATHIAEEKANLQTEKDKWQQLIDSCDSALASFDQTQQQQYAQQQEQQQEFLSNADSFCRKYNRLRNAGPGPGCEDDVEDLADDMDKVVSALDSSVNSNLAEMKSICLQVNNEQSDLEYDDSVSDIVALCETEGSGDAIMEMVNSNISSYIPGLELNKDSYKDELDSDDYTANQKRALRQYVALLDAVKSVKENNKQSDLQAILDGYTDATDGSAILTGNINLNDGDDDDFCVMMENKLIIEALKEECGTVSENKTCAKSDVTDQIEKQRSDKSGPAGFSAIGGKAMNLISLSASPSWSDFGESPEGNCFANDASSRVGTNSYSYESTIPGLDITGSGTLTN